MADPEIVAEESTLDPPESEHAEAEDNEEPEKLIDPLSEEAVDEEFKDELAAAEAEAEDELEEFEWNGKPIKGPKGLKDGVLMHADYTRKTQGLADQRKALEEDARRVQEQAQLNNQDLEQRAEYVSVRKQLEQYGTIDWQSWNATDPGAAQAAFFDFQRLKGESDRLGQEITQRAQKRTAEAQQAKQDGLAKRLQETQEWARANVKGWKPETDKEVIDFALEQGVDFSDLQSAMNSTIYNILHLARIGHQVINKPASPAAKQQTPATPLKTVGAKSSPPSNRRPEDIDDMDQYVAARKKQMAAKG